MMELEIEIPIWWMYLAFPTGFAVLALFAAEMALRDVQQLINSGEE
jgi:TRAP-type C4-dicarboxylate transport system permease small subunit